MLTHTHIYTRTHPAYVNVFNLNVYLKEKRNDKKCDDGVWTQQKIIVWQREGREECGVGRGEGSRDCLSLYRYSHLFFHNSSAAPLQDALPTSSSPAAPSAVSFACDSWLRLMATLMVGTGHSQDCSSRAQTGWGRGEVGKDKVEWGGVVPATEFPLPCAFCLVSVTIFQWFVRFACFCGKLICICQPSRPFTTFPRHSLKNWQFVCAFF